MRHRKKGKILKRKKSARIALLKGLTRSLILHEKIETTLLKAKVVQSEVARQITWAKIGTLHARRESARVLDSRSVKKLFDELGRRYKDRRGGYTRVMKKNSRKGDNAKMAVIEFV
ncbi:MAG: 50S ribosomal protein L17 [Candidatus Niyogibacteria bacterium]|nr:50S ribosomal protein L17 [Candidatus Niyogibacteria bacterium]